MPIYEYSCQKCGAHLEVMQKITDKPLARHSQCGGKLVKEWSQTSFQLKGSGWYVTDYAGKKSEAKADEAKGEKKPAAETTKSEPAESKKAKADEKKPAGETKAAKSGAAAPASGD
ncbi:MAG TPA: FmdB family zinc ribbon protein [Pyrinomonadaceae bacterium]|nr:FmdB family zinc ribbon protein [Pyrinomonadaceae bacterium]